MNTTQTIKDYHRKTKHRLEKYASGPETIDWESQPDHFRYFEGTEYFDLPLAANTLDTQYTQLWGNDKVKAQPLSQQSLGIFFELALGLSAWKVYGTAKWSVRCNPSSGNLHPTEAYAILPDIDTVSGGIYHYCPERHGLERRAAFEDHRVSKNVNSFYLGLSSVAWREAWKYGERAFRYCQLDTGHALMAIRIAAANLGWNVEVLGKMGGEALNGLFGLDRDKDFFADEREHAEVMLRIGCDKPISGDTVVALRELESEYFGKANKLDRHHFYDWPIISQAFASTEETFVRKKSDRTQATFQQRELACKESIDAAHIIKTRRSATDFNPQTAMSSQQFIQILEALVPHNDESPWDIYPYTPGISLVFYVHRVVGIKPGLYALIRDDRHLPLFQANMRKEFQWEKVDDTPPTLPFYRLLNANAQSAARTLSCHQAIASNGSFCASMISDYANSLEQSATMYRHLHWEAGMIGQILYLEAETINFRGTGIGCFFDDSVHETLGITDETLQVVYHFTIGDPVIDHRITSLPPYGKR